MASVLLKGMPIETIGEMPEIGSKAPDFTLTSIDMAEKSQDDYAGKTILLNIFPSIDTPVCALSVQRFNKEAGSRENTVVLCVSADLPFAHQRFCGAEGIENVVSLSTFRNKDFGKDYGLEIITGPLTGLLARAVVVIAPNGTITCKELVPEIGQEPNYKAALDAL